MNRRLLLWEHPFKYSLYPLWGSSELSNNCHPFAQIKTVVKHLFISHRRSVFSLQPNWHKLCDSLISVFIVFLHVQAWNQSYFNSKLFAGKLFCPSSILAGKETLLFNFISLSLIQQSQTFSRVSFCLTCTFIAKLENNPRQRIIK